MKRLEGVVSEWTPELRNALLEPFNRVGFLPKGGSGEGKKQGLAFIDARDVMKRLDDCVGLGGWSFSYSVVSVSPMMVTGILTVLGVTKCDAGEATQEGEQLKSAVSDALKRCGVHFGIGRYLYELDPCWGVLNQYRRWEQEPRLEAANLSKALVAAGYTLPEGEKLPEVRSASGGDNASPSRRDDRRGASGSSAGAGAPAPSAGLSLFCEACGVSITEKVASYSRNKYGRPLCMEDQKTVSVGGEPIRRQQNSDDSPPHGDSAYVDPFEDE